MLPTMEESFIAVDTICQLKVFSNARNVEITFYRCLNLNVILSWTTFFSN